VKKQSLILFTLAATLVLSSCAKKIDFVDTAGNSGQFSDYHGQWLIINYWATWCKPCIEEIPELNTFAKQQMNNAKLFAVDFDNAQGDDLIASSQKMGIEFSVLTADPSVLLGFDRPSALPTTVVFNPEGTLHKILLGPQTEQSLLQAMSL
jgi:thiol-disulfide isomerase/thioredoxin